MTNSMEIRSVKRSWILPALLLVGLASPLFASLPTRFALQIQQPEVSMIDAAVNQAELTIKATFLHSLWDDVALRAPGYAGDNDDLSLAGSFLLERVQHRWPNRTMEKVP